MRGVKEERGEALSADELASLRERLERRYAVGDHRGARALAREVLRAPRDEPLLEGLARRVLVETEPDRFFLVVGLLGLGVTLWLVYNYVL